MPKIFEKLWLVKRSISKPEPKDYVPLVYMTNVDNTKAFIKRQETGRTWAGGGRWISNRDFKASNRC